MRNQESAGEEKGAKEKGKETRPRSERKWRNDQEALPNLALNNGSGGNLIKYLCHNACWEVRLLVRADVCAIVYVCVFGCVISK